MTQQIEFNWPRMAFIIASPVIPGTVKNRNVLIIPMQERLMTARKMDGQEAIRYVFAVVFAAIPGQKNFHSNS
jgi:hypothetical protein